MSEEKTEETRPARWWVRFVGVPLTVAVLAALSGGAVLATLQRSTEEKKRMSGGEQGRTQTPVPQQVRQRDLLDLEGTYVVQGANEKAKLYARVSYMKALRTIWALLWRAPELPRANFNAACFLSRLAAQDGHDAERRASLGFAEEHLRVAMENGLARYFMEYRRMTLEQAIARILNDEDMVPLFKDRPRLKEYTKAFGSGALAPTASKARKPIQSYAGGGCVEASTPVLLAADETKPIGDVHVGDLITTVDRKSKAKAPGRVVAVIRRLAYGVVVVNENLVLTSHHPVATPGGWVRAGQLRKTMSICTGSGTLTRVQSVQVRTGRFEVIDLNVEPVNTFVAGGIVLHNKDVTENPSNEPGSLIPRRRSHY